ncbi:50S ribosomal protein L29 [Neochlamydia sp. EPS4]|uniref:50S ribosomal protein L29 n=1 Tax=unclassified Neochlamydia TaxID=2643326 RepID=UPI00057C728A|nr:MULTISPECIES: 50S ribosomal protein L29 [unclassified Neochlamydia]KIC72767.1 50S ribosomal protein L29 [Neochlamydia sp. EPS4]KIC76788.1 50S ribosomal protein L29 [Neochlamydia sp. TUME1]MBS4165547.1 50S ribosomal protein L29 [Neochlamydia sp. AcF65]MBS4169615.1 50S ribosomal protein L29 [Neochlamydia sp. AcF95]NGY94428.1 50S ribosomal protein L29 [Neochlamydia sp. AcF84]
MKKAKDFRDQSLEDLEANCKDARRDLFNLINEMKQSNKVEKPHLVRHKKREIALLLTVINEKKRLA